MSPGIRIAEKRPKEELAAMARIEDVVEHILEECLRADGSQVACPLGTA